MRSNIALKIVCVIVLVMASNISSARDLLGVPYLNEVSFSNPASCLAWIYGTSETGQAPSCAQDNKRMVFDMCTETGKAWLSIILTYSAQGKTMKIVGSGTCNLFNSTESVNYLRLNEGG